jgi:cytosine/adenosine deaminase-related metal-dependent hydrolase
MTTQPKPAEFASGRPVVFRNATVITMDSAGTLENADVLVTGDTITAVGPKLEVPAEALEIDATGGIITPGFIDTHRHMWQTNLRGYGGDWRSASTSSSTTCSTASPSAPRTSTRATC